MRTKIITCLLAVTLLTGCQHAGQNQYNWQDVGQATTVEFGRVVAMRPIEITGPNSGVGAMVGAGAGAIGGSYIGRGGGSLAGMLAGAVIAGVAGGMAEQAISDHSGIEYTVTLHSGKTITLAQNYVKDDRLSISVSG